MSKTFIRLTQLILVLPFILLFSSKTTLAANCTFIYRPDPPNQNMTDLAVTINSNEITPGTYNVRLATPIQPRNLPTYDMGNINFSNGTATITLHTPVSGWIAGAYKLYFIEEGKPGIIYIDPQKIATCQTGFNILDIPISDCDAKIEDKPIEPSTGVKLTVNGIKSGSYDIFINNELKDTKDINSVDKILIGNFNVGTYTVSIKSRCGILGISCTGNPPRLQCNPVCFTVAPLGSGGGGQCETNTIPAKICSENDIKSGKCSFGGGSPCEDARGPAIKTAIGCIHTSPAELTKDLMTFLIGIGGGLAFLMMLLGAFQMLTSAGNPETLNAGKDRLTSAVIGLLFIIFSILLLQIIGFDILKIPGFGR